VTMFGIVGSLAGQESPYFHENFFGVTCFALFLMVVCPLLGLLIVWRSASRQVHASKCKRNTDRPGLRFFADQQASGEALHTWLRAPVHWVNHCAGWLVCVVCWFPGNVRSRSS